MEILAVLNENGEVIGKGERKKVHEDGLWHIHVGAWLMNEKGELLFQQRSHLKKVNPLKWTRTGGHVDSGETTITGVQREVEEEIGIKINENEFELIEIEKEEKYNEDVNMYDRIFVYSYFAYINTKIEDFKLQEEEVEQVKYITIEDMEELYKNKNEEYTFTKWGESEINKIISYLKEKRKNLK